MSRKILVVDDNAINRQMLINVLESDYDIIEAENGKEALTLMHRHYKLLSAVLLDILMPVMNGYEVLRTMRENALLSQIPVIMVTSSEDEESRVKSLSLGANDFISKPFNPDIVRHCLRNNITLRETASILNAIQKDKLTGLYNREAFFEKVNSAIKYQESGSYILSCFDVDNFKLINDQYGAPEGDRILKELGAAIKQTVESIGGIASRISADNFAALIPAARKDVDILRKVREKRIITAEQRPMVFSVGRYLITDLSLPASAIYDRAYIAKQSVKGRYDKHLAYFDQNMLEKLVRDQVMVGEMETALAGHQFELWFQPQYNHVNGKLTGAEALVRWRHPEKGIIPPGDFIPLFEQNGFVYELDKYVWRETCRYLRKWLDEGLVPLPVSVNISRYDIFRADLIETICGIINEYDVPIDLMRLEITESAFAKSTKLIVDIVKKLLNLGFTIEIDDFGSGYSSLNTLKSVPAQIVKLDMRFLDDGDETQRSGNILESIVRMTKWLGMSVVAEGVETKEQGDFLKSIGCSHVQGYLYAEPMPAEEYESHFKEAQKEETEQSFETAENFDNSMFWNPRSMDSLIFNSFVGSACIFEYYNGRIELVRATDKYAHMLGGNSMTVDKLMEYDLMSHMDDKVSAATLRELEHNAEERREFSGEFLFVDLPCRAGELYVRSTMRVVASADKRYLVYCISEDITAQRRSEYMEKTIAKQLQAIMENLPCGITAIALGGGEDKFLLANDKFYELLGYTEEQYSLEVTDGAFSFVTPEDRQHAKNTVKQTLSSGQPKSMEYRVICRDGTVKWLRSFLSVTSFEESGKKILLCTYADITAEKNVAQVLLDNMPCGVGICVGSGENAYMSYLNKRFFTYFKHSSGRCTGASVYSFVHPDDHATLRLAMSPAHEKGNEGLCVVRIKDGEGEYIPFRLSAVAMEFGGSDNAMYVTIVPISQVELSAEGTLIVALEKVMKSSTELSFVKDKNLRYLCCSRAFSEMLGLESEKDVVGKTDFELFDKELAQKYASDDKRLMEDGKSIVDFVEYLPAENGRERFSSTSKYLLYDSLGNVVGLYGTGRDITRTREVESRQEFLLNNIPGGVAVFEGVRNSADSIKLSYYSDGYCRLYGYTREEYDKLFGKKFTSLVSAEYLTGLVKQIDALMDRGVPIDYVYRAAYKGGGCCWIHIKAVRAEQHGDNVVINAILFDITEHQEALERLRVSEEENRLAIRHSGNVVCRYDVAGRSLRVSSAVNQIFDVKTISEDVPYGQVRCGNISPETADSYIRMYESILRGEKNGSAVYQRKSSLGWRWLEANFSTIFSSDGEPVSAVLTYRDVTENFEKEITYKKWRQSLHIRGAETYSLFRCNLSKRLLAAAPEGALLQTDFDFSAQSVSDCVKGYVKLCVFDEEKGAFFKFLNIDSLLERYYRGERTASIDYRELRPQGGYRWLRLTVDMVEYPHSTDVEAYLLVEDIDEAKRAALLTSERAETDPLTGVYNRVTFKEKADAIIKASGTEAQHALFMLDIDGFKYVNDAFGHMEGDKTLIEMSKIMRSVLRKDDLIGRLGGDEFVVFLKNISDDKVAVKKAKRICELSRKTLSAEVSISVSVGIALCPSGGRCFEVLYKNADEALYHVKGTGKDNFALFRENMNETDAPEPSRPIKMSEQKRRMLIVDDSKLDNELLANMFKDEFSVEKVRDGNSALIRLRHYGTAISVVLLDLMMPGMDGFVVLKAMQENPEMRSIPVVVVSGADDRETSLRAIRSGASDFVTKPVDADVLRIRVYSAVSKAENERLRAKNNALEQKNAESVLYNSVLDKIGLAVAELDWGKGTFSYSPAVREYLKGTYDGRSLWHILMTDMVADMQTVRALQQLVHDVADNRTRTEGDMEAKLKTPSGKLHSFVIHIYKLINEYGLANKIILTFKDVDI